MFKPNFSITNKITNSLVKISESRTIILHSPLIPKWELELRRNALINSAHASTSIEGNTLTFEEVSELMIGREVTASQREKQEVLNYFKALEYLDKLVKIPSISHDTILDLHKVITKDVLEREQNVGAYRTAEDETKYGQTVIGRRNILGKIAEITFIPPKAAEVLHQMSEFIDWLNDEGAEKVETVLYAGVTHYEFVRIHPFTDGNGRTARALASLTLLRRGFDAKRFFTLDDFYNSDKSRYYNALKSVDHQTQDLTQWLEYFTEGVEVSITAVRNKVLALSGENSKGTVPSQQIALNTKEIKVVEFIRQMGHITNKDVRAILGLSDQGALLVLEDLMRKKVIRLQGKGRATRYILSLGDLMKK